MKGRMNVGVLLVVLVVFQAAAADAGGDETKAIQARIDAVSAQGGGKVSLAKGDHFVSSLFLKDGVNLHLEAGARLIGSRNPDDYERDLSGHGYSKSVTRRWSNAMIRMVGAKNVAVTGEPGSEIYGRNCYDAKGEEGFRGPHAISAYGVTDLVLEGYRVRDAGNFGIYASGCTNVTAVNVRVDGGHDGFDFFGCRNVRIEKCRIYSGDDCVAGHGNAGLTVRDCELNSACSFFRLGGNDVLVENCHGVAPGKNPHRYSLTEEEKRQLVCPEGAGRRTTLSVFTYFAGKGRPGARMLPATNIVFRNCRFAGVERMLHYNMSGNERWQVGRGLGDVMFENVEAEGLLLPLLAYAPAEEPLRRLTLRNCRIEFRSPVKSLLRGANVDKFALDGVTATGVGEHLMETWGDRVPSVEAKDVKGVSEEIRPATAPYTGRSI